MAKTTTRTASMKVASPRANDALGRRAARLKMQKTVDTTSDHPVDSSPAAAETATTVHQKEGTTTMPQIELVQDPKDRKTNAIVYNAGEGLLRGSVRVTKSLFKELPTKFTISEDRKSLLLVDGEFAEPRKPLSQMTPEEKKAFRKAQPKPTLEQQLEREEKRVAKLRAKIAAQANQPQEAAAL